MHRQKAAFLSAVSRGDIGQVRRLVLEQYHHLECAHLSWTGLQPLQVACKKRYDDLALFLVEKGAPISTEAFYWAYENRLSIVVVEMMTRSPQTGLLALLHACESKQVELAKVLAKVLIGAGASVNIADKRGRLPLLSACENGNTEIVKLLINAEADVKRTGEFGRSPLLAACENDVEIVKLLIDAGADVNEADELGRFPLLAACERSDIEIVKLLILAGAEVQKTDEFGRSPLLAACENDVEIVKLLIDAGADVNEADEFGRFPLLAACEKSDIEIVKLLILAGAEVQKTDENETFSLLAACECEKSDVEIVDLLIDAGAEVNRADKYERFSLLAACRKNDVEIAKLLINAGADVRKTDKFGTFPLLAACENSAIECVKLLIEAGVDINKADQLLRRFPLLLAACQKSDVHFVKTLIEAGVDVNKVANDLFKKVPLLAACEKGDVGIVQMLIDAGADVNKADVYGIFPLLAACEKGDVKIVEILINAGANCNEADVYGIFPLLTACYCKKDKVQIAQKLINAGADVNKVVLCGMLPWLVESECGNVENAIRLLDAGADASKADKLRKTPLVVACEIGDVEIARLLIGAGANMSDKEGRTALYTACSCGHYSIGVLLINVCTKFASDSDESILRVILQRHRYSTEISTDAVTLVKMIVTRSPFLTTLRYDDHYLFHEMPCPVELQRVLVGVWVQYRYRELYAQGTTKPNVVKICVMGEAGAGKTTLIKSLRSVHWTEGGDDRRTASVDVTATNIKFAGKLVFWDFAGQQFFHKTHGLFFSTSSTIFLLIVDVTLDDEEQKRSSHYWMSFVKCSVSFSGKAYVLVIGSKEDLLSHSLLKTAKTSLSSLVAYLRTAFGRWFHFSTNVFVLNCRQKFSEEMSLLRKTLRDVKILALEAADEVPSIVETAKETLLPLLRNVGLTTTSLFQKFTSSVLSWVSSSHRLAKNVRKNFTSVLRSYGYISDSNQMTKPACIRFLHADVFQKIMLESVCAGFSEHVQSLFVEFLQAIGEILVIRDTVILDPPWLCQNVVGPLLSPKIFPIHLDSSLSGTASKENIQSVLEIFNKRKWDDVDHTISLLRRLEICYPVLELTETYQFPALIEEHRPPHVWRKNPDMTVYVGRRLMSEEKTDIITPGTMPFIQSSARNASCFRPSEPIVWQGGLLIKRTIGSHFVEGMIIFQNREKAMDFIVRGPKHSEKQCMKHLRDLMGVGTEVLLVKSPGTTRTLWYISRTELEALKDFPLAHKSQTVEETIKMSKHLNAKVCQKAIEDTLKDLLALPDDHFTFVPYEALCTICECLDKDTKGRSALAKRLPGLSTVDRYLCKTSEQLLTRWGENLEATTKIFADCARASGLLYLLMILYDCGSLKLSADEKKAAKADLDFVEASTPSVPATRKLTRLAPGKRTDSATDALDSISTSADSAAASQQQDEDSDYLDSPVTSRERFEVAERIQPIWKQIGRVLRPEPFKHYELHAFGEKANDRERALEMLEAWAMKFGSRATRGQLIDAMMRFSYSTEVAEIFSVSH